MTGRLIHIVLQLLTHLASPRGCSPPFVPSPQKGFLFALPTALVLNFQTQGYQGIGLWLGRLNRTPQGRFGHSNVQSLLSKTVTAATKPFLQNISQKMCEIGIPIYIHFLTNMFIWIWPLLSTGKQPHCSTKLYYLKELDGSLFREKSENAEKIWLALWGYDSFLFGWKPLYWNNSSGTWHVDVWWFKCCSSNINLNKANQLGNRDGKHWLIF